MNIEFKIIKWETSNPYYELEVDGKSTLTNVPIGELRKVFYEMEKYARLRFKESLR